MCKYCDPNSNDLCIFQDWPDDAWYLNIRTSEWDDCDDDFVYQKEYIDYCPYCGRSLYFVKSCKTCKFSTEPYLELYHCNNTEFNLESNQRQNFYCSKWEEKEKSAQ